MLTRPRGEWEWGYSQKKIGRTTICDFLIASFILGLKPELKVQTDSICPKLFV